MLQSVSSVLIISGCGQVGINYAKKFSIRVKELSDFQTTLEGLKFNIMFLKLPILDSLVKIYSNNKNIKAILEEIVSLIKKSNAPNLNEIWAKTINENRKFLCLKDDDIKILLEFAENLGAGDIENEINNIELTNRKLKIMEEIAREECKTNSKLYKGIGFLFGIFLVTILI